MSWTFKDEMKDILKRRDMTKLDLMGHVPINTNSFDLSGGWSGRRGVGGRGWKERLGSD